MALNTKTSIVDYYKWKGWDSSFKNRTLEYNRLFKTNDYKGTAEQNIKFLNYYLDADAKAAATPKPAGTGGGGGGTTGDKGKGGGGGGVNPQLIVTGLPDTPFETWTPERLAVETPENIAAYEKWMGGNNTNNESGTTEGGIDYSDLRKINILGQTPGDVNTGYMTSPNAYEGRFDKEILNLISQLLNPKEFSYDPETDPSYQAYKKQYELAGERSFKNTIGDLTTLTGGRLNSWATSAASQSRDYYMQQLSNKVPELFEYAYGRYRDDQSYLLEQLKQLQGYENTSYGKWKDEIGLAMDINTYNRDIYQSDRDFEYNRQLDDYSKALKKWEMTGKATQDIADILGVNVGDSYYDYDYKQAALEIENRKLQLQENELTYNQESDRTRNAINWYNSFTSRINATTGKRELDFNIEQVIAEGKLDAFGDTNQQKNFRETYNGLAAKYPGNSAQAYKELMINAPVLTERMGAKLYQQLLDIFKVGSSIEASEASGKQGPNKNFLSEAIDSVVNAVSDLSKPRDKAAAAWAVYDQYMNQMYAQDPETLDELEKYIIKMYGKRYD